MNTDPLSPDEIATIVGQLENWKTSVITSDAVHVSTHTLKRAAAIIRAVVLENERLKTIAYERWKIANARIRELEAERDSAREVCTMLRGCIRELEAERDAIRLKTIEECAEIAAKLYGRGRDLPAIIRALGQSEGKEEET